MIIQNNIAGINASRNRSITDGKMKKSLEKLSSGYRINRAGDDAAGLTISELMRTQIRGLEQAMRNTNDGIGLTQTGDGALAEVHSMLGRMKTLATQSANGTYTTVAREGLDFERQQLIDEINRIGLTTNFDEVPLFDGESQLPVIQLPEKADAGDITLQIGHTSEETLDVPRYRMNAWGLNIQDVNIRTIDEANAAMTNIDLAIEAVADIRAGFGASQSHLEHTYQNLSVTNENMTSAESRIRDTDMADEFTSLTRENVMFQAGASMCAQANSLPEMVMNLLR
ncbi:MAG: flagellin [Hungatella sp.]|jgi:flagellin|nr:flagellin [Hungatella sp.]